MNRTLIAVALTSRLINGAALSPRGWRAIRSLLEDGVEGADLAESGAALLQPDDRAALGARLASIDDFGAELRQLEGARIEAICEFDEAYPKLWLERLGAKAPPVVFTCGKAALLRGPCLAIVGSRDADGAALRFARECARAASESGLAVASGGARGVDAAAMRGSVEFGGVAIGVLADGLLRAATLPENAESLESGRLVLCSPYAPAAPFATGNAMGRNKLVYALSEAAVVVSCAAGSGGTWAGAVEALRAGWCPVLAWQRDALEPGARALVAKGAFGIRSADEIRSNLEARAQSGLFE